MSLPAASVNPELKCSHRTHPGTHWAWYRRPAGTGTHRTTFWVQPRGERGRQ